MKPVVSLAIAALAVALASPPLAAEEMPPAYASKSSELMYLDNGVVVEGRDLETPDGYTSGFSVIAGFTPLRLPRLDLGAEFSYRESDEVPTRLGGHQLLLNTTSMGGSLLAGVRFGSLGLYAKSGVAGWEGNPVMPRDAIAMASSGTTRVHGFGARLQFKRLVSRLEFEEFAAPDMSHLNMITASLHFPF